MPRANERRTPFDFGVGLHDNFEMEGMWRPISQPEAPLMPGYVFWTPEFGAIVRMFGSIRQTNIKSGLIGKACAFPNRDLTLLTCRRTAEASGLTEVQARMLLIGKAIQQEDERVACAISLTMTHLGEWMVGSLFQGDSIPPFALASNPPQAGPHLAFGLPRAGLFINLNYGVSRHTSRDSFSLTSRASASLAFTRETQSIDDAWELSHRFRQLIDLMTGERSIPMHCEVQFGPAGGFGSLPHPLFFGHPFKLNDRFVHEDWFDLRHSDIEHVRDEVFEKWFSSYDLISRSVRYYFDVHDEESIATQVWFLNSVLAYETLVRVATNSAGNVNVRASIADDLSRGPSSVTDFFRGRFGLEVANAVPCLRSHFVHGNQLPSGLSDNRRTRVDLGKLCFYLFRYRLLEYLGIPTAVLNLRLKSRLTDE